VTEISSTSEYQLLKKDPAPY